FRGGVELNWGGAAGVTNNEGDDFVVYENGSPNGPEAFMIAVRETGTATFTGFRYEFADDVVQVLPTAGTNIAQVLSTGFDLSDFGLPSGSTIDAIIASNMRPADRVDDVVGQGNVIVGGGSGFSPLTGPQGNGGTYNSNGFDPDLTYIGVNVDLPTNDPGDFIADGNVDGEDFLAWQRGESPDPLSAADLGAWQTNYGAAAATFAVPEPTSAGLLGLSTVILIFVRRERRR
ncbi:MAG: PEP-CTERM sorting domain-containing protein, partial [Lacipirellulaceae bacterium]